MADVQQIVIIGLIASVFVIGGGAWITDLLNNYGVPSTDLTYLNQTQGFVTAVQGLNTQLDGTANDFGIFGIAINLLNALGAFFNVLLGLPTYFITLVSGFNAQVLGGSVILGYVMTVIQSVIVLVITYAAIKFIRGDFS